MSDKILWIFVASFLMAVAACTVYAGKFDEDVFPEDPFEVDNFEQQAKRQEKNYSRTCGTTTKVNNTYFTSPGYPAAYPGAPCRKACTIVVKRCNYNICQLRIDLLDMVLSQPDGNGVCTTDALTTTGGNSWVPTFCGDNTGQTLFVNFNGNSAITISVTARLATAFARRWNIRLTQLGCDCLGSG